MGDRLLLCLEPGDAQAYLRRGAAKLEGGVDCFQGGLGGEPALAQAIEERRIDLIVGTQIVAKGWHFPHLTLVGVVDADLGLEGGDLRAAERTFQQIRQVSGRAGRGAKPGHVFIQTHSPSAQVMQALIDQGKLTREIVERQRAKDPKRSATELGLGAMMVEAGILGEANLLKLVATRAGLQFVSRDRLLGLQASDAVGRLTREQAEAVKTGEQLGDHGLIEKLGFFEESYRIPCIVRAPGRAGPAGRVVEAWTENVDVLPTLAELLGQEVPLQCDGRSLVPFLDGAEPEGWRTAAHWEYDWRDVLTGPTRTAGGRRDDLERCSLAVLRTAGYAYVQFADASWRCFDLGVDPTWRTTTEDPAVVLPLAQEMLTWRAEHQGGVWSQTLVGADRRGLWPAGLVPAG